ncbi:MAG TPA: hypothetical protein VG406_09355 [Isosphaeraceae bacterium]|jgi:hypothetical protein|nr:hypothetical protein [Isosphaeraceae bacterium]
MGWAAVVAVLGLGAGPGAESWPLAWSPGGDWVAVTLPARPSDRAACRGWLLGDDPTPRGEPGPAVGPTNLWAARADDGSAVLLERAQGPLTAPAWKPDGTAVAFGRLVPGDRGRVRFEIVVQEGVDRRRVLASEELDGPGEDAGRVPALTLDWSPDGTLLATPRLRPRALDILLVADGKRLGRFEEATWPSWSPDGSALAFFRGGAPATIEKVDRDLGTPRRLVEVARLLHPPIWAADGRALLLVTAQGGPTRQVDLSRLTIDGHQFLQPVLALVPQRFPRPKTIRGTWVAADRQLKDWFVVQDVEGEPSQARRIRPGPNPTHWTSGPLDPAPGGAVAVAPDGRRLALRFGPDGLPALLAPDAGDDVPTPIAPDDATRRAWLAAVLGATRALLRETYPDPTGAGRATILPVPGEEPRNLPDWNLIRLRRLVKLGRKLSDPPESTGDAGLRALRDEARVLFAALDDDYPAALAALAAVETRAQGPDERCRLLGLRAQLLLGRGQPARARDILAFLRRSKAEPLGRWEAGANGPVLVADPQRGDAWVARLADRAEALGKSRDRAPRLNLSVPRTRPSPAPNVGPIDEAVPVPVAEPGFRPAFQILND